MKFMLFVIDTASNTGNPEEMKQIDAFNAMLQDKGHWVMAAGIGGSPTAQLIDNRMNLGAISPSSLNGSEFYSGFWIIQADGPDQAKDLAMGASLACNRKVELRPFLGQS